MSNLLTIASFTPHLDTTFSIALSNGELLALRLIEITSLGQGSHGSRTPFSLIFCHPNLPRNAHLPQQTYHLHHAALGTLTLFLVPLGPDQVGMRYQAIFT
ncbi:MAG: hypothetical protein KIH69_003525 [Anaerolineae bacterium]|nr:hypothetical protein [Anaerolineae bacterium]